MRAKTRRPNDWLTRSMRRLAWTGLSRDLLYDQMRRGNLPT